MLGIILLFMILPTGTTSFLKVMRMGPEVYKNLMLLTLEIAPNIQDNHEGLELLK